MQGPCQQPLPKKESDLKLVANFCKRRVWQENSPNYERHISSQSRGVKIQLTSSGDRLRISFLAKASQALVVVVQRQK
jgi:hypothetical protein